MCKFTPLLCWASTFNVYTKIDWEKGQWLPTVACAILTQLIKQPMKGDFKRYMYTKFLKMLQRFHIYLSFEKLKVTEHL